MSASRIVLRALADRSNGVEYLPVADEVEAFIAAWQARLPVLLKGPTGCGKTRLVQHVAARLDLPLATVSCHEDMTAADLVGRHLLEGGETVWHDGPLTRAVRQGGICYIDEIVEAGADATVVLHSLADHRRQLFIERQTEEVDAPPSFMLVVSYNPGYQSLLKDLKPSTRQRFVAIELSFPPPHIERDILQLEAQVDGDLADRLVTLANAIRQIEEPGLAEVASTRTLIAAAKLMHHELSPGTAVRMAVGAALTDDVALGRSLSQLIDAYLD